MVVCPMASAHMTYGQRSYHMIHMTHGLWSYDQCPVSHWTPVVIQVLVRHVATGYMTTQ